MQKTFLLSVLSIVLIIQQAQAQAYDQLATLEDHTVKVYHSRGHEARAGLIARRVDKAMHYYEQLLDFKPTVTLLILSAADWDKYTKSPVVYGMPHYNDDKTLIVAAEDNPFWKSFVPPLEQLPADLREQVREVYTTADSSLSMQAFFDLLAIHELGHAFQFQSGLILQRRWMGELFSNMMLHAFIAENEPTALPALTIFPRMVVSNGSKEFSFTSLQDIQEKYSEIARRYPKNYGWFQCRWHMAGATIYDASGSKPCKKLWDALMKTRQIVEDKQLLIMLDDADKTLADLVENWDRDRDRR